MTRLTRVYNNNNRQIIIKIMLWETILLASFEKEKDGSGATRVYR